MLFRSIILSVLVCMPGLGRADPASIYDYRLGEHIIDYPISVLDVISADLDGLDGGSLIRLPASNATEVLLNFSGDDLLLHYIEHDWIDRDIKAQTALGLPGIPDFTFGETRAIDIQAAFEFDGFHYKCRQSELLPDGMLSFISFELPSIWTSEGSNAVYTFVVEHSKDLSERGVVDPDNSDFAQAVLVGTIVSTSRYNDNYWCTERMRYTPTPSLPSKPITNSFYDFLPDKAHVVAESLWVVETEPFLLIQKNGALTYGDLMQIIPEADDCNIVKIIVWAHTYEDDRLMELEGTEVNGSFNVLFRGQVRRPLRSPVILERAMFAPINDRRWPPFAVGSFVFGWFDFDRLLTVNDNPDILGFSLELPDGAAGMRDNYWSLEGLSDAGEKVIELCEANK